ncbi:MAG: ubiquinone/menaquinone biosynthesis methyltransferase [Polyangiaceae bacterium]
MNERDGSDLGTGSMFDAIADRYDFVNRVMSFGTDVRWRRLAVSRLGLHGSCEVLDLATGTADVALAVAARTPGARVLGTDPSDRMLDVGRAKIGAHGLASRVRLARGSAEAIDADDASFDGVTIAFGIRNVKDRPRALREMARVVRPGGRVVVLELTEPRGRFLGRIARWHVHDVVPRIGAWLSGAREYRYLERSIAAFPPAEEFAATMATSGVEVVETRALAFGAATLFVGVKPGSSSESSGAESGVRP